MTLWKQGASAVPVLARLRIIFGSAGIGIGSMLPIGIALVTEFAPPSQFMSSYGSRARDRPARAAGAPSRPNRSPRAAPARQHRQHRAARGRSSAELEPVCYSCPLGNEFAVITEGDACAALEAAWSAGAVQPIVVLPMSSKNRTTKPIALSGVG
jgi:hypothetical protein